MGGVRSPLLALVSAKISHFTKFGIDLNVGKADASNEFSFSGDPIDFRKNA